MKNFEKYEKEISKLVNEDNALTCSIAIVSGFKKQNMCSSDDDCKECQKKCLEWMYADYKEQILTDEEKEIVRVVLDLIHKFGCTVIDVKKIDVGNCDSFISIRYENPVIGVDDTISFPIINNDKFKGMELNRKYALEELGLENVNG